VKLTGYSPDENVLSNKEREILTLKAKHCASNWTHFLPTRIWGITNQI